MRTKQTFVYGFLAIILTLAFTACENPTGSSTLTGITAVYNSTAAIYPTTPLNDLKAGLIVTAQYSDNTSKILASTDYTLSGTLTVGTSAVTVTYEGKTTTFTVTVTAASSGDITYTVARADGVDGTADTTAINFTFSASVTGLTANDITVTNGTGSVTKGALNGSGTSWTLGVTINTAGNVTVSINKSGIESGNKTVTVYKTGQTAITYTAVQTGGADNTADTTGIAFTFSASVTGLTANDITVTNGTGSVTKGTLSGSGTSWSLGVTVTTAGNVTIAIAKTGIEAGTKNVAVFKAGQTAPTLTGITAVYTQGSTIIYPNTSLDSLKAGLTVKAQYNDGTSTTVGAEDYELSGTLTVGSSAVTVTYEGKTTTFNVTVTAGTDPNPAKTLTGITLNTDTVKKAYTQNETLNLNGLVVTANYSDSTSAAVSYTSTSPANGSTLSTYGTITVTVNYTEGTITRSNTFTVNVTAAPAHAHQWSEWTVTTAATCMATGTGSRTCATCGEEETVIPIDPNAHQLDPNYIITPPTCTTAGSGAVVCLLNSAHNNPSQQVVLPALGHLYGNWTETTAPLCETDGEETRICSRDSSHKDTRSVTAIGHDWQFISTATETTDGVTGRICRNDSSHNETTIEYATGTVGLSFEAIGYPTTAYRVRKGTVYSGTVHIPAYHRPDANSEYKPVTEIGSDDGSYNNAAFYNTSITSIIIPTSVTYIGNYAFYQCTGLTSINIPTGVTSIGNSAFSSCTSLTSVTFEEGVTSIGNSMFTYCTSLTSVTIPESVTSIGVRAFESCFSLTSITTPAI